MKGSIGSITTVLILLTGGFFGLLNSFSDNAQAPTFVSGIQYDGAGGPWNIAGSPYIIAGNVTVPAGQTLTIDPGVQVRFDDYYSIFVDGTLNAVGSSANRINITSNKGVPGPSDWDRIQINTSGRAEIRYCGIGYGNYGIWLESTSWNNITDSSVYSNNNHGIHLLSSANNNISSNNISNNYFGVYVDSSSYNILTGNDFSNDGLFIEGSQMHHFTSQTIGDDNTVNGKPLHYYKDCSSIVVDGIPVGQLIFANCTNVSLNNLQIDNTDVGIEIAYAANIDIVNSNITNNDYGMYLISLSDSNITRNNVSSNNLWGTYLRSSSNNNITFNNVSLNGWHGFYLDFSPDNNITSNNVTSNIGDGISLGSSSNNKILDNVISSNNGDGIYLASSTNNNITSNDFLDDGIHVVGSMLSHANSHTIPDSNLVNGKPLKYLKDCSGLNIDGIPVGQLILANCVDIHANNLQIGNTDVGIELAYSEYVDIKNTKITNSRRGILLYSSSNNNITNAMVFNNLGGIHLYSSSNNNIISNNISSNIWGILLSSPSSNNRIHHNDIIENINQAYDSTNSNSWNDTYPSGGNYWSDWSPICIDNFDGAVTPQTGGGGPDGICDSQYNIDVDSIDHYPLTNFAPDTAPPIVTYLQPLNSSLTTDNTPAISADYWDLSGIDISSVLLKVDGLDVTLMATVSPSCIIYTPMTALSDGTHVVYLEVRDNASNLATVTWSFAVDATPPAIGNMQPPDTSSTNDNGPIISADYSDAAGIDTVTVKLKVDGIDVTSSATVASGGITFSPTLILLADGVHHILLELKDVNGNTATAAWSFTVDTTPAAITDLQPPKNSIIGDKTPTISANYSDSSGIDLAGVFLEIDGANVTSLAVITATGVTYTPASVLADGIHSVYLEIRDRNGNVATLTWTFTVESPSIPVKPSDQIGWLWWVMLIVAVVVVVAILAILAGIRSKKRMVLKKDEDQIGEEEFM